MFYLLFNICVMDMDNIGLEDVIFKYWIFFGVMQYFFIGLKKYRFSQLSKVYNK